jgi:lysyl-tRNA synthetase class 1
MKDLRKTYELSQPYQIPKTLPYQLPYRHLVTLVQIGKKWQDIKQILLRTKQIPKKLSKQDENHLIQRTQHVLFWVKNFAPNMVKFHVQEHLPKVSLTREQKAFLTLVQEHIPKTSWNPENIHNMIYEISEENNLKIQTAFKSLYQVILGQEKGPRAGYFLSNLDKQFVLERITESVK